MAAAPEVVEELEEVVVRVDEPVSVVEVTGVEARREEKKQTLDG